ncbi:MAG: c-type cytochrome [Chlorobi bacterium]|nr:c-type cytochrome [Chlorobiota bacterium]
MVINGFVTQKARHWQGFLTRSLGIGLFILLLVLPQLSFSQTAADEANFVQCRACHTIGGGKLVGPDLKGINEKQDEAWIIKFVQNSATLIASGDAEAIKVFEENNKIPMPPHNLTDDQVRGIIKYIANGGKLADGEAAMATETTEDRVSGGAIHDPDEEVVAEMKRADMRNMRNTFLIMLVLMLISIFDLSVSKFIKARWIHIVIILISIAVGSELLFVESAGLGRQQYYQPDQPIAFSHKIHAGQNQIDCQYCHFTADKSMHAGIPPLATCMNCHSQVKEGKKTGKKEIAKIYAAFKNNKPIEWVKVHNLPDHVYFNHAQHVKVGKVACAECHGEVEKMDEIIQVKELSMGWCIDCHRTKKVQFESNRFYDQYTKMHEKLKNGEKKTVTVLDMGGEDCQRCHY